MNNYLAETKNLMTLVSHSASREHCHLQSIKETLTLLKLLAERRYHLIDHAREVVRRSPGRQEFEKMNRQFQEIECQTALAIGMLAKQFNKYD
jgi:hypothetical protein